MKLTNTQTNWDWEQARRSRLNHQQGHPRIGCGMDCNIHQHTQRPTLGHRLCWLRACHPLAHGESESGSGPSWGPWRTPLVGRNPTGEHVSEAGHWLVKVVGRCVGWWESLTDWEEPVQTIAHCHLWKPALGVGNVGLDYHPCQFA